jgi:predicted alpha/beta superfamily hydrolase
MQSAEDTDYMNLVMKKTICGMDIEVYAPLSEFDEVLYVHSLSTAMPSLRCAAVSITGVDWDSQLTPWPAPKAFRGGRPFSGNADEHLAAITGSVISEAESCLGCTIRRRIIAGYSLAGLFAVYSLFRTDAFNAAASGSGSFWFDAFADFAESSPLASSSPQVYLSLGDLESHTSNTRLAAVGDCTERVKSALESKGASVTYEMNHGGHFDEEEARMERAYRFMGCLL